MVVRGLRRIFIPKHSNNLMERNYYLKLTEKEHMKTKIHYQKAQHR